jgi:alginate O-acetyltransferase complex protein AlgI
MPDRSIAFLLLVSYVFYWNIAGNYIACLIFVSMLTWYCGRQISQHPETKKRYLYLAIFGAIGQLILFKFSGILPLDLLDISKLELFKVSEIFSPIPLGLSFYTLASITYVFDIYRGKLQPARSIREYALFVSFFPLVTSGPIARARDFLPQLSVMALRSEDLRYGATLIVIGLIKKYAIADNIGLLVDPIFLSPFSHDSAAIVLATFAFGLQLYFDFSGYSDIAIGIARVLGLKIPRNFNIPYIAANPSEFWHRWNISLSSFLRDYLYIPLGGNRKGNPRTYLNLTMTMILCGLWHGATWNFLIWGAYHGGLLAANRLIGSSLLGGRFIGRFWTIPKVIITQYFVFLGWLFFRISDQDKLTYCLSKFLVFNINDFTRFSKILLVAPIVLLVIAYKDKILIVDWVKRISLLELRYWIIFLITAILLVIVLAPSSNPNFIYQTF